MFKRFLQITIAIVATSSYADELTISVPELGLKDVQISSLTDTQRIAALRNNLCKNYDSKKIQAQMSIRQFGDPVQLLMAKVITCTPARPKPDSLR
jgi:hypothetical protein